MIGENGYKLTEILNQEYTGNNCKFSAGFVDGHPDDTMYIKLEKDGFDPLEILLRPDEVAIISWLCSGILWSKLIDDVKCDELSENLTKEP